MRNPGGYALWTTPEGVKQEADSFTCSHCCSIVIVARVRATGPGPGTGAIVKPFLDPREAGDFCMRCMRHICKRCAAIPGCRPYEKLMEERERAITEKLERSRGLGI